MKTKVVKSIIALVLIFLLISSSTYTVLASSLSLSTTRVRPGENISVTFSGFATTDSGWIGFYREGADDRAFLSWRWLRDLTNQTFTVQAPKELGAYNFRIFRDGGFTRLGLSASVQVVQYTPTLSLARTNFLPNEQIVVSYSDAPIFHDAWIGFFKADAEDRNFGAWTYLKGNTSGTFTVTSPWEPGQFNFRIFLDMGYTRVGISENITVREFQPSITLSTTSINPRGKVTAFYSGSSTHPSAWIGFYRRGAVDTAHINWVYTGGKSSGSFEVTVPNEAGSFEFRIFKDGGYTRLAVSPELVVTATPIPPVRVSGVTVAPTSASINIGATRQLTPTIAPANATNRTVTWSSSHPAIARVDANGLVTGVATGTATITVTTADGNFRANSTITVTAAVPTPPAIIGAEAFRGGVRLTWQEAAGLGYRLFRSTEQGVLGISVTDFFVTGTSFADVNVEPNTTYFYTIKPVLAEARPLENVDELLGPAIHIFTVRTGAAVTGTDKQRQFIKLRMESPNMSVNGVTQEVDPGRGTTPITIAGRTMIPIRAVVEAMGGQLRWDAATQKVTLIARGNTVEMWLNRTDIRINGVDKRMDVAPVVRSERTFVPVRFAAENLGSEVDWISSTREIVIIFD